MSSPRLQAPIPTLVLGACQHKAQLLIPALFRCTETNKTPTMNSLKRKQLLERN